MKKLFGTISEFSSGYFLVKKIYAPTVAFKQRHWHHINVASFKRRRLGAIAHSQHLNDAIVLLFERGIV